MKNIRINTKDIVIEIAFYEKHNHYEADAFGLETQENKELLFKDLCARLPYYVG